MKSRNSSAKQTYMLYWASRKILGLDQCPGRLESKGIPPKYILLLLGFGFAGEPAVFLQSSDSDSTPSTEMEVSEKLRLTLKWCHLESVKFPFSKVFSRSHVPILSLSRALPFTKKTSIQSLPSPSSWYRSNAYLFAVLK